MAQDRVTVQEAARRLGIKEDAVRKRIQRGSIEHDKDLDGRVYVYLDDAEDSHGHGPDTTEDAAQDKSRDDLVEALRDQVGYLRGVIDIRDRELEGRSEEIRRRDHIIAALVNRVPELEASATLSEPPKSPESTGEGASEGVMQDEPEKPSSRPSLWRRIFG